MIHLAQDLSISRMQSPEKPNIKILYVVYYTKKANQSLIVNPCQPSLKKISGTKTVPLGHHLIVRKMVPFGAPFWCHFPKGHYFVLVPK